jgi:hypothetical protein
MFLRLCSPAPNTSIKSFLFIASAIQLFFLFPFVFTWCKDTNKMGGVWLWGMKKDIKNKFPE